MNRTVNALEERGDVTRVADADDRRKVRIAITDTGRAVVADTVELRDTWLATVFERLTADEQATLHDEAAQIVLREVHR